MKNKDYEVLVDVFTGIYDVDEDYDLKINDKINSVQVVIKGRRNKILPLRNSDIFFRVERLTDYRISNVVEIMQTFRDISKIIDEDRDFYLVVEYYHMRKTFMDKGIPFEPRDVSYFDKMEKEFNRIRKEHGLK